MNKPIKLALEFDDFHPQNSNLGLLEDLRDHYPEFKVSLFTIPMDIRTGQKLVISDTKNVQIAGWREAVLIAIKQGWMELCVHGLTHIPMEFGELPYEAAKLRIIVAERCFREAGLPYAKVFKAPNWALSKEAEQAITDTHEVKGEKFGGFRIVKDGYYKWNLRDDIPKLIEEKAIVGHGHIQDGDGCFNGLNESYHRILKVPPDTKWLFISEYLKLKL